VFTRLLAEVEPGKNLSNITLKEKDKSADFQSSTCIFPARWSPSLAVHQIHAFMFLHLSWTYPGKSPFSQGNKGMDPETMQIGLWARMALFNFGNLPQISIFWILVTTFFVTVRTKLYTCTFREFIWTWKKRVENFTKNNWLMSFEVCSIFELLQSISV